MLDFKEVTSTVKDQILVNLIHWQVMKVSNMNFILTTCVYNFECKPQCLFFVFHSLSSVLPFPIKLKVHRIFFYSCQLLVLRPLNHELVFCILEHEFLMISFSNSELMTQIGKKDEDTRIEFTKGRTLI